MLEVKTIGDTAGLVWNFLRTNGESSLSTLEKRLKLQDRWCQWL